MIKLFQKKEKIPYLNKREKSILDVRSGGERVSFAICFIFFVIYAAMLIVPFIWLIVKSFEDPFMFNINLVTYGSFYIPTEIHPENYVRAFTHMQYNGLSFLTMLFNSIWMIFVSCTYCLFWPTCVAYVLAKYKFKGRDFIYSFCIVLMIIPMGDVTGAHYKMIAAMGLYDTGPIMDIVTGIGGFGEGLNLVIYAVFKGISWNYAEAVYIDGGSDYTVFFKIMLPQAMPALSSIMVARAIGAWNEYYSMLMYKPSWLTISAGLYYLSLTMNRYGRPLYYAGLVISMIPILIAYVLSVDGMMKNLTIGGLKG